MTYFLWAIGAAAYNALACPITPGGTGETTIAAKAAGVATGNQIIGRKVEVYSGVRVNADLCLRYTSVSVLSIYIYYIYSLNKEHTHRKTRMYSHSHTDRSGQCNAVVWKSISNKAISISLSAASHTLFFFRFLRCRRWLNRFYLHDPTLLRRHQMPSRSHMSPDHESHQWSDSLARHFGHRTLLV